MQRILPSSREWPLFDITHTRHFEVRAGAAVPPHTLMQRAGKAVACLAMAVAPHARSAWVVAGPGNNGGDGLEAAIHLARAGRTVEVTLLADATMLPSDARTSFDRAVAAGIVIRTWADRGELPGLLGPQDIVIDALLGTGASRPPDGPIAQAIQRLNAVASPVLAVDVPSGLNADTGQPLNQDCVIARHTLTLLTCKPGLFTGSGRDHAGITWFDDLGAAPGTKAAGAWLLPSRPAASGKRRHAQHKGSFGDIAIVGGAAGMIGAALLAARAAHAAGAGRVYVHLLHAAESPGFVDTLHPELMFRGGEIIDDSEQLARSTVVCGCGGGQAVSKLLPRLLSAADRLVLDADALNAMAADPALLALLRARADRSRPCVITPHPLEAARLLGQTTGQIEGDRLQAAATLVDRFQCVVVLKGSGTVIAAPRQVPRINASGNASLATGGTGDVLAGWLGGLWAQQHAANTGFEVSLRAVGEHGAAADPEPAGALRASDLIEALHRQHSANTPIRNQ